MTGSSYESAPGVEPVRVQTLRGLRRRARRGQYIGTEASLLRDFFTDVVQPSDPVGHRVR